MAIKIEHVLVISLCVVAVAIVKSEDNATTVVPSDSYEFLYDDWRVIMESMEKYLPNNPEAEPETSTMSPEARDFFYSDIKDIVASNLELLEAQEKDRQRIFFNSVVKPAEKLAVQGLGIGGIVGLIQKIREMANV